MVEIDEVGKEVVRTKDNFDKEVIKVETDVDDAAAVYIRMDKVNVFITVFYFH